VAFVYSKFLILSINGFVRVYRVLFFLLLAVHGKDALSQPTNALIIPDSLGGPVFDLAILDTTMQFFPSGLPTSTYGYNAGYLGPTLYFRKGEFVTLNVTNNIRDTTTTHWHGMHIAAHNDGGSHSMILPGETWSPDFSILNETNNCK
jgi:bilirubin oxidase